MPRPAKRAQSENEVAALAAQLGRDWQDGDLVLTWLRRHVVELTGLVQDQGWTWHQIGRALNEAGIMYRTGRPWTGRLLNKKAAEARGSLNERRATMQRSLEPAEAIAVAVRDALNGMGGKIGQVVVNLPGAPMGATPPAPPAMVAQAALSEPAPLRAAGTAPPTREQQPTEDEAEDVPTFAPASIIGWTGSKPQPNAATDPRPTPPAPAAKQDADEVMKRFLGKAQSSTARD